MKRDARRRRLDRHSADRAYLLLASGAIVFAIVLPATGSRHTAATRPEQPSKAHVFRYHDIPSGFEFPTEEHVLLGYVLGGNRAAIRRHAWNLWAGLTSMSSSIVDGQRLPVFATWYSVPEVYNPEGKAGARRRPYAHPEKLTQSQLANSDQGGAAAGLMSFVKLNQAAADFIWKNRYNLRSTLTKLKKRFDAQGTPTVERSIKPFPPQAAALKLVFWLVKNPRSPQSSRGLTALPVWNPNYPPPPGGQTPMHTTWTEGVAVDPGGRYATGSLQRVNINGTLEHPRYVMAAVVPLSRFYWHKLTNPQDVADARVFMNMYSSAQNEQERFITNPGQTPELNDYIILLAMHATTKEMDCWTFQTFWWSPAPNEGPFARDRTPNVKPPFTNYLSCTAYSMVTPREPDGGPPICFNPYLETDLGPTKSYTFRGITYPPDPMAGTRTNCMNCHRHAGFPAFQKNDPDSASMGRVFNQGYLSPDDPYFDKLVKTDFLWSIALKSVREPKR
jgi:hypothetical protein